MKPSVALLAAVLAVLLVPNAAAQHAAGLASDPEARAAASAEAASVPGAVIVVRQLNHARAALKTAEALRLRPRFEGAVIEIVVCGEGSQSLLATSADAAGLVAAAEQADVRLLACGLSLARLGLDAEALAPGIGVVDNGLLHALERQADGFLSVEL